MRCLLAALTLGILTGHSISSGTESLIGRKIDDFKLQDYHGARARAQGRARKSCGGDVFPASNVHWSRSTLPA